MADKEREKEGTGSLTKSVALQHFDPMGIFHVYKLLKTSMDREAWHAAIHGVAKSRT